MTLIRKIIRTKSGSYRFCVPKHWIDDLEKLKDSNKPIKYFFVIDKRAEEILKNKEWAKRYNKKIKIKNLLDTKNT